MEFATSHENSSIALPPRDAGPAISAIAATNAFYGIEGQGIATKGSSSRSAAVLQTAILQRLPRRPLSLSVFPAIALLELR